MGILGRQDFDSERARKVAEERVPVPEIGGPDSIAIIRGMSGHELDSYNDAIMTASPNGRRRVVDMKDIGAKLIVRSLVDEQGKRVYTDEEFAAVAALRGDVYRRLHEAALTVNGMNEKDLQDLGKLSAGRDGAVSSSDSPSNLAVQ